MKITDIEKNSVEIIPNHQRTSSTLDLFKIIFGSTNTFATVVLGSFPILFGLSIGYGALSILLGIILGSFILAPMGLFGPINGTNNAVSSGAHFGIHGRIIGSFLSLLTAITFFALSVWSSGDALAGGLKRAIHLNDGDFTLGAIYLSFIFLVLMISIYGYKWLLLISKSAVTISTVMFVLGLIAFAPQINFSYAGTINPSNPTFWPIFISSTLIAMSNPISFGAFLGDWSRYLPRTTPRYKIISAIIVAQLATLLPFLFGLFTAAIVATHAASYLDSNNYIGGLLALAPNWYYLPLCIIALIGGISTGASALYGTGLDVSSIFPSTLNRVSATILSCIFSMLLIFIGRFWFDLTAAISTFAALIIVCTTPWIMIMVIGFIKCKGAYHADDLQVFNRGEKGGRYWFHHGWNWRGVLAWIPSAILGILFVNIPGQFVGYFGYFLNNLDISLLVSSLLSSCIYLILLALFPEHHAITAANTPYLNTPLNPLEETSHDSTQV